MYRLSKEIDRRVKYLDQVSCIKDEEDKVLVKETHIRRRWQTYFHRTFE